MFDILWFLKVPTVLFDGMTVTTLVVFIIAIELLLAFLAMRGRGLWSKLLALVLAVIAFAPLTVALAEQLSYPKPISLAWVQSRGDDGISIKQIQVDAPRAVYLWVVLEDMPRSFSVPWSKELEESLQSAEDALSRADGNGELRLRIQKGLKPDPQFFGKIFPPPPLKQGPGGGEPPKPRTYSLPIHEA